MQSWKTYRSYSTNYLRGRHCQCLLALWLNILSADPRLYIKSDIPRWQSESERNDEELELNRENENHKVEDQYLSSPGIPGQNLENHFWDLLRQPNWIPKSKDSKVRTWPQTSRHNRLQQMPPADRWWDHEMIGWVRCLFTSMENAESRLDFDWKRIFQAVLSGFTRQLGPLWKFEMLHYLGSPKVLGKGGKGHKMYPNAMNKYSKNATKLPRSQV